MLKITDALLILGAVMLTAGLANAQHYHSAIADQPLNLWIVPWLIGIGAALMRS